MISCDFPDSQAVLPREIVAFSNFYGVVWTGNIYCAVGVKTLLTNFYGVVWTGEVRQFLETGVLVVHSTLSDIIVSINRCAFRRCSET